jgi:hypothetical protein
MSASASGGSSGGPGREPVARCEARHRLDQRAKAGFLAVGAGLAEAGNAADDQARVARQQDVRAEADALQRAGPEVLDQGVRIFDQPQQDVLGAVLAQVEPDALLVAAIRFPVNFKSLDDPVPQRIAARRPFDLDHLGAEVGKLQRQHVAGDEARHIENAEPVERAFPGRIEFLHGRMSLRLHSVSEWRGAMVYRQRTGSKARLNARLGKVAK